MLPLETTIIKDCLHSPHFSKLSHQNSHYGLYSFINHPVFLILFQDHTPFASELPWISQMASNFHFLLIFSTLLFLVFTPETGAARAPFNPTTLFLPVLKDNATSLHIVNIQKGTPLKSISFLVDLNGKFLSVNCEYGTLSTTYRAPICHSTQCSQAGSHFCHICSSQDKPGCHNNTCGVMVTNPLTHQKIIGELAQDILAIQTVQGSNPGPKAFSNQFLFACTPSSFQQEPLPNNTQGIVGFSHSAVSLPRHFSSHFGFPPKFSLCLATRKNQNGVIFLGNPSYKVTPQADFSQDLQYTPLYIGSQGEYFIPVKSIRINHKELPLNTSLLSRSRRSGGTMISTAHPYTVLEHSIFQTFTQAFGREFSAIGASQTDAVSPFGVCFNKLPPPVPKVKIGAPIIDFVMQNQNVTWSIYGSNSIIRAGPGVWCLAFVDGGVNPRAPIVVGVYQLEDHIFEFDLVRSRLGFTQTLLSKYTTCSGFNFSATA